MAKPLKNLYLRGNTLYMKFTFMGQYVHKSTFTDDPKLAALAITKAQKEIYEKAMTIQAEVSDITFGTAIEETYRERWVSNNTGSNSYRQAQVILDFLGEDIKVTAIGTRQVREVQAHLRTLCSSESTVNRHMAAFRTVILHACESYHLPPPKFSLTKESSGRIKVFSYQEEEQILKWFVEHNEHEMSDIVAVLFDTGFRLSECLGIGMRSEAGKLISEAHLELNKLSSWENKGAQPRTIPMTTRVKRILEARGFTPWTLNKNKFEHRWDALRKGLKLKDDCVSHACRHTCASRLLASGRSLLVVQKWLGHADIKTTMIYLHLAPNELDGAALGLEGVTESVTECAQNKPKQTFYSVPGQGDGSMINLGDLRELPELINLKLVPEVGIEPTRVAPLDFESSASTSFTTRKTKV